MTAATRGTSRRRVAAAVVVVLLLVAAFVGGRASSGAVTPPDTHSAAAGFLRDMQVHHAQAVQMALLVRDRSTDPSVRLLAYDIATGQSAQAGQMYGLLDAWGLPQATADPRMTWMGYPAGDGSGEHAHATDSDHAPGSRMPGMATDAQLAALTAASGADADRIFLRLMIAHHRGGVEMAKAVLVRTDVPQVTRMARAIVAAQSAEIRTLRGMLAAAG